ncbi:hypothetical protein F2Q69_00017190, partial [Brassica cretica]
MYSPLWVVDFSENQLSGKIPPSICNQSNLILLNLGSNRIFGEIPPGVLTCKPLQQLRVVGNRLTGRFPTDLCKLVNLSAIELDQNRFSGPLPAKIEICQKLQRLHLAANRFSSSLPKEISKLSNLVTFNVSSNSLTGPIPSEISNCKMLQRLDLSRNSFVGHLPCELGSLHQLEILRLNDNRLSGNIPYTIGNLTHLTELQMGGNLFSGSIPPQLGSLSSLQIAMNLSYNDFSGEIPPELGNLYLLMYLSLNNNHLSGEIPTTFENLSSLLGCNFSYNNLTGPLPLTPLFQNMTLTSFLGDKGLCGGHLRSCDSNLSSWSNLSPLRSGSARRRRIIVILSSVVGGVSLFLIAIVVHFLRQNPVEATKPSYVRDKEPFFEESDIYFVPKERFTVKDILEATKGFHESYIIGKGACGTVYKAVMPSGKTIAVKKLGSNREGGNNNNTDNSFRAEILTLGKIRHRNIVRLYSFCYHQSSNSNLLLYEYMSRGSLGEILHGGKSYGLDWPTRFGIALGAAEGLAYLHHDCKPRIIHRDIKSNNILLDENFEAHVGDFGLAKVIDMPVSKSVSAVAGSYGYIAP